VNPFHVGSLSIAGIGLVLDNSKGFTLYHLTTDSSSMTTCTGGCAQVWPPLVSPNGKVPASPGLMGSFGLLKRPDGTLQVTYNGMPVYRYAGDSGPGQSNGQGIGGVWFAVKVA
jgi:predicted lipoprotein with Yx(FWY)xxD motif